MGDPNSDHAVVQDKAEHAVLQRNGNIVGINCQEPEWIESQGLRPPADAIAERIGDDFAYTEVVLLDTSTIAALLGAAPPNLLANIPHQEGRRQGDAEYGGVSERDGGSQNARPPLFPKAS